jgi:hypothetical protein
MSQSRRDWASLNAFFDVGTAQVKTLMDDAPSGALFCQARVSHGDEPAGLHSGVIVLLLKAAVVDLRRESSDDGSRATLYAAAIAHLTQRRSASTGEIVASGGGLVNPYR